MVQKSIDAQIAEFEKAKKIAIDKTTAIIAEAIDKNSPFAHNIISCALRNLYTEVSNTEANKLVDKFKLTRLFGIHKHK